MAAAPDAAGLRKTCVDAMNATGNEAFARSIIQTAINKDLVFVQALCESHDTIKAHKDAAAHVEKNERHVFAAYAAMWVLSALFLLYLFRRQGRLKAEIAQLRRELDAAAGESKAGK
jgi:CcmD family protein